MIQIISTCQEYKPNSSSNSSEGRAKGENFLEPGGVCCQSAAVSKPSFRDKDKIKGNNRDRSHCDEERLKGVSSDV
jgi:hypothetical protein